MLTVVRFKEVIKGLVDELLVSYRESLYNEELMLLKPEQTENTDGNTRIPIILLKFASKRIIHRIIWYSSNLQFLS